MILIYLKGVNIKLVLFVNNKNRNSYFIGHSGQKSFGEQSKTLAISFK